MFLVYIKQCNALTTDNQIIIREHCLVFISVEQTRPALKQLSTIQFHSIQKVFLPMQHELNYQTTNEDIQLLYYWSV